MKLFYLFLALARVGVPSNAAAAGLCRVVIADSTTAADSASIAAACRTAEARYLALTGRAAPSGTVLVGQFNAFTTKRVGVPWEFEWPSEASCRLIAVKLGYARAHAPAFCARQTEFVLPHELGHVFNSSANARGKAQLPAWYEEGAAMWMESAELQVHRLTQAQEWRSSSPDLASLMAVAHPRVMSAEAAFTRSESVGPCHGVCGAPVTWHRRLITRTVLRDGVVHVDTLYDSAASSVHADSVARFYVYSLAALHYVKSRGGVTALHLLADRVRISSAERDLLSRIPGIPAAGPEREADWHRWLQNAASILP